MFDRTLIDEYVRGGELLRNAVAGLSREQLLAFPIPGTWSIQQIVVHMMDSDAVGIDRMKRLAAMENPLLIGYDETAFINVLYPEDQPIEQVLDVFDLNRKLFTITLRKLPDETFARSGVHNERGKVTLGSQVQTYIEHLNHHLSYIEKKRKLLEAR